VPDHVGERLGAEKVHGGLDRRRQPGTRHLELDRNRQPGREGADGRAQPALGEDRRVDAGHDLAQFLEPGPGVAERLAEQLSGPLRRGIPLLLGQLKIDKRGDEPLLGAVVQVAGYPPASLVRGGHEPHPRLHQVLFGAPALGDVADVARERGPGGRPGAGHRHLGRELRPVGAHRRHLEPLVQDVPLSGGQMPGETPPVLLTQGRRHDQLSELPAGHVVGLVTENMLERAVHVRHAAEPVGADDRVERGLQHGPVPGLARGEFGRAGLGHVAVTIGLAAQLGLCHAVLPGQLRAQHGRGVLQRGQVSLARGARRVDERDDAPGLSSLASQSKPGLALVNRARLGPQPADELPPLSRRQLSQRAIRRLARGGAGAAGLVLDHHAEPGEVVQGLGDASRACAGHDLVQPVVDSRDLGQGRHRRLELGIERGYQLAVGPLARDQLQPGDDRAAQLREHGQQEDSLGGEGFRTGHHEEDWLAAKQGRKRERPVLRRAARLEAARPGQACQCVANLVGSTLVVFAVLARMPGHRLLAARNGRDGRCNQPDEMAGRRRLGQDQRQSQDRVGRRQPGVEIRHRIFCARRALR
jgi:hypothetical protein